MTRIHLDPDPHLKEINQRIALLKEVCDLHGDDELVFSQIVNDSLDHAAHNLVERARQELKGLLFMKTLVRYRYFTKTHEVLPTDGDELSEMR